MAAASLVTMIGSVARADARSEARGHFKIGMSAIADGRYDQGIRELQRAYQILPHPNVLFNIARAYAESGDVPDALTFYQRYLESSPSDAEAVKATIARRRRQACRGSRPCRWLRPDLASLRRWFRQMAPLRRRRRPRLRSRAPDRPRGRRARRLRHRARGPPPSRRRRPRTCSPRRW
jgi:tetratricopeptide (TPR) repeat protein